MMVHYSPLPLFSALPPTPLSFRSIYYILRNGFLFQETHKRKEHSLPLPPYATTLRGVHKPQRFVKIQRPISTFNCKSMSALPVYSIAVNASLDYRIIPLWCHLSYLLTGSIFQPIKIGAMYLTHHMIQSCPKSQKEV